jgi:Holliday junction resolvase
MAKLESCVQREIITYLERCGWYVVKLIQTNKNGIPDLMAVRDGRCIFIEVKRAKQTPKPLQMYRINELIQHGATSFVSHSVEEIKEQLQK